MTARKTTRSDIKWLLNEVAALSGELAQLERSAMEVASRRAAAERSRSACARTLAMLTGDGVTSLRVRAHRNYGGRGALRACLRQSLEDKAPAGLDSMELSLLAVGRFELELGGTDDFYRFKNNSILRALSCLQEAGLIERIGVRAPPPANYSIWRWKQQTTSLHQLRQDAAAASEMEG
jgi:hypothetical protein